jgi:CrcB protein
MDAWMALCVAAGGLIGAPSRFLVDRWVTRRFGGVFPLGTFAINISGSLLLGMLVGLALAGRVPGLAVAFLGTGFCGAFTTFSTWTFETARLLESGAYVQAASNVVASLVIGLAAAGGGLAIGLS